MILVDRREKQGRNNPEDLIRCIRRLGVTAEVAELPFGDIALEGQGPQGTQMFGIERKTVQNMLGCIDDHQYSAHQIQGLKRMYGGWHALLIEGHFRPHDPNGFLMQGEERNGDMRWYNSRFLGRQAMYAKLRRYLFSVQLAGIPVLYTRDLTHTAWDIHELYHYLQKPWHKHTALQEMQIHAIPTLSGKPSVVRKWGFALEGIGNIHSADAERVFQTPLNLALADEVEWLKIPGVGVKTAQDVVAQVRGWKR